MNVYNSILDLIGSTPIVKLNNFINNNLYVKLESYNPTGSVKDRIAKSMYIQALNQGKINSKTTLIEPTSGNTGIGLSLIGACFGNEVIIVMPENMSKQRIKIMESYGAKVVLTSAEKGMAGSIEEAKRLNKEIANSYILSQFDNLDNPETHYKITGPEIWNDMDGKIDILICGIGTGGTISGVGKYLKEQNPNIIVIGVEPEESPIISKGYSGKHKIQGIGAGFIPKTLNLEIIDKVYTVKDEDAINMSNYITKNFGLFVGISSGAVLSICKKIDNDYNAKNIVVILPDSKNRYI